jgi:hypothetical protein
VSSPSTAAQAHRASARLRPRLDAQLRYLCNDAQWPPRARFAALAAATESFAPYVGPKWTYIGFLCGLDDARSRPVPRTPDPDDEHTIAAGELPLRPGHAALECGRDSACAGRHAADHDRGLGATASSTAPQHLRSEVRSELPPGEEPATGRDHPPSRFNTLPINRPCTAAASHFPREMRSSPPAHGRLRQRTDRARSGPGGVHAARRDTPAYVSGCSSQGSRTRDDRAGRGAGVSRDAAVAVGSAGGAWRRGALWPLAPDSSRRLIEPGMRFSRTRLTDVLRRRRSVSPATAGWAAARRRCR